jgi:hypothetical protein
MGDPRNIISAGKSVVVVTGASEVPANSDEPIRIRDLVLAAFPDFKLADAIGCDIEATGAALQVAPDAAHMGASPTHVRKIAAGDIRTFNNLDALDWFVQAQDAADTSCTIEAFLIH